MCCNVQVTVLETHVQVPKTACLRLDPGHASGSRSSTNAIGAWCTYSGWACRRQRRTRSWCAPRKIFHSRRATVGSCTYIYVLFSVHLHEVTAHPPSGVYQVRNMKHPAQTPPCHLFIAAQLTPQPPCGRSVVIDEHHLTSKRLTFSWSWPNVTAVELPMQTKSMYTLFAHVLNVTTLCNTHRPPACAPWVATATWRLTGAPPQPPG